MDHLSQHVMFQKIFKNCNLIIIIKIFLYIFSLLIPFTTRWWQLGKYKHIKGNNITEIAYKMSSNLKKWLPILKIISEISDKKLQIQLIKYYSRKKNFNLSLREIFKNVIKGNVRMSVYKKRKLQKIKKNIYSLAYEKNLNSKIVSKNFRQSGGSLFYVIPLIASLLMK